MLCAAGATAALLPGRDRPLKWSKWTTVTAEIRTVYGKYVSPDQLLVVAVQAKAPEGLPNAAVRILSIECHTPIDPRIVTPKPPIRLRWTPSANLVETVAKGAIDSIEVIRVEPDGLVTIHTPDNERFWGVQDGQWTVELQLTADGYEAGRLQASFSVAKGALPTWTSPLRWV